MNLRLSGHFSLFGLVLGIARQWSREKFTILTVKPWNHVKILIYHTWAIQAGLKKVLHVSGCPG